MTQPPTGPWRPAGPTPPPGYHQPYWPQPPRQRPTWERLWPLWVVLGVVAVVFVSCTALIAGSADDEPSAGPAPAAVAAPSATQTSVVVAPPSAVQEAVPTPTEQPVPPPASAEPELVVVPDVVGNDLQSAQETLFPPLRSTSIDATGQGRLQMWDRNWVVVRQDPPAGTQVPELTDVKLYVVKEGEQAP
ncbi:MAG: hypothetical protein IRZ08_16965 [Frankia sp.]|nr:hypothetical protein [Frankia sp.]